MLYYILNISRVLSIFFISIIFTFQFHVYSHNTPIAEQNEVKRYSQTVISQVFHNLEGSTNLSGSEVGALVVRNLDLTGMRNFVLGRHMRSVSQSEINRFDQAFKQYMTNIFAKTFSRYQCKGVQIKSVMSHRPGEYLVKSSVMLSGAPSMNVDCIVRKMNNGQYKVFDILTENYSMINNIRVLCTGVLESGGISQLTREINTMM